MNVSTWRAAATRPEMWVWLSVFSLMAMESTVIALWYQALLRSEEVSLAYLFTVLLSAQLASFAIAQGMERWQWPMAARQVIFLAWIIFAVFASLKVIIFPAQAVTLRELVSYPVRFIFFMDVSGQGFYHLLLMVLLVSRGVVLAGSPPALKSVQIGFQLWLILLMIYGMVFARRYPVEAAVGLYAFLFCGLVSMSTARVSSLSELRGAKMPRFGVPWLLGITLAALAVVGLAVFFGWLASSQLVAWITRGFIFVFAMVTALLIWLATPVFDYLARALPQIIERIGEFLKSISGLRLPAAIEGLAAQLGQVIEKAIPVIYAGRIVLLVAVVALLVAFMLLGLRLGKRRRLEAEDDQNHARPDEKGSGWSRWWQQALPGGLRLRMASPDKLLAAARIRLIYRQLMALSQKLGAERPPAATPYEFLPHLEALLPEAASSMEQITAAYVKIRYGEYPETMQEVESVQAAWDSVRRQGSKKLAAVKKNRRQGEGNRS